MLKDETEAVKGLIYALEATQLFSRDLAFVCCYRLLGLCVGLRLIR